MSISDAVASLLMTLSCRGGKGKVDVGDEKASTATSDDVGFGEGGGVNGCT